MESLEPMLWRLHNWQCLTNKRIVLLENWMTVYQSPDYDITIILMMWQIGQEESWLRISSVSVSEVLGGATHQSLTHSTPEILLIVLLIPMFHPTFDWQLWQNIATLDEGQQVGTRRRIIKLWLLLSDGGGGEYFMTQIHCLPWRGNTTSGLESDTGSCPAGPRALVHSFNEIVRKSKPRILPTIRSGASFTWTRSSQPPADFCIALLHCTRTLFQSGNNSSSFYVLETFILQDPM